MPTTGFINMGVEKITFHRDQQSQSSCALGATNPKKLSPFFPFSPHFSSFLRRQPTIVYISAYIRSLRSAFATNASSSARVEIFRSVISKYIAKHVFCSNFSEIRNKFVSFFILCEKRKHTYNTFLLGNFYRKSLTIQQVNLVLRKKDFGQEF